MSKTVSICSSCSAVNRFDFKKSLENKPKCGKCQSGLSFHEGITDTNLDGLNKILSSTDLPVVVDLWAPWCGPCLGFAPVYQKLARETGDRMVFLKINTEAFPDASSILGVRGIPTLILFKNKDELKRQSGAMPESMLRSWLAV